MPPRIEGLLWTEDAERHVEEHINAWEIDELVEGGDFYTFPNKAGHPPKRWRVIGRIPGGLFVTTILAEPRDGDPTHWEPVTGGRSDPFECQMYMQERKRLARKRGQKHG
jgi:hypothetical protein